MKTVDHHRETLQALYALLHEYPDGLTLEDVSSELSLTRSETQTVLDREVNARLVDIRGYEEGQLLYVSMRKIRPEHDSNAAIDMLRQSRARHVARRRANRAIMILGSAAIVTFGIGIWLTVRTPANNLGQDSSAPTTFLSPTTVTIEDRVEAQLAADRSRRWSAEAQDIDKRIERLDRDAAAGDCAIKWANGEPCHTSNRLLTKVSFDEERARLALRSAELKQLVGSSK
jgi:hypothetical protein